MGKRTQADKKQTEQWFQHLFEYHSEREAPDGFQLHPCAILKWAMDEITVLQEEINDKNSAAAHARIHGLSIREASANAARRAYMEGYEDAKNGTLTVSPQKKADKYAQAILNGERRY